MIEPYYDKDGVTIYNADCRTLLPMLDADCIITDPPYGDTALEWDQCDHSWIDLVRAAQVWAFGSMRYWLGAAAAFDRNRFKMAQDLVWEKHNGSGVATDRFRRVHEHVLHWYRGSWSVLRHEVPTTADAVPRRVARSAQPTHTGRIGGSAYETVSGGPRLMRSVQRVRSCHHEALHPTQKPLGILEPLVRYCVKLGGVVLDPFAGSGSTLVAARQAGRRAIGIEIEEKYCEIAVQRLAQGVFDFDAEVTA